MNKRQRQLFEKWLKGRPQSVQQSARKYPPGTRFLIHGKIMHVISYYESGAVSVTPHDPAIDHELAVATRQPVCSCCVRKLDEARLP